MQIKNVSILTLIKLVLTSILICTILIFTLPLISGICLIYIDPKILSRIIITDFISTLICIVLLIIRLIKSSSINLRIIAAIVSLCILPLIIMPSSLNYYLLFTDYAKQVNHHKCPELLKIATDLENESKSKVDLALKIMQWVQNNINNIYGTFNFHCIRIANPERYPAFILATKCGACGEYAALYLGIANTTGLKVRMICINGDHALNEVLINNKWIIVDASINLFNHTRDYYHTKWGLKYEKIIAIYPNGTIMDITNLYKESIKQK